jgi:hypothetical protein
MEDVRRVCDRGIVLYAGQKAFDGSANEAVAEYANVLRKNASSASRSSGPDKTGLSQRRMTHGAKIERVELVGPDNQPRRTVQSGETVYLLAEVHFFEDTPSPVFATSIRGRNGEVAYDTTTRLLDIDTPNFRAGDKVIVKFKLNMHLLDGIYNITTDLAYADLSCYYDYVADVLSFVVHGGNTATGVANLQAHVSFAELPQPVQPALTSSVA